MEMEKKNLAIIILAVVLAASGIGNVILAITGGLIVGAPDKTTLVYGFASNPAALDPVDTWDVPSNIMQHQVTQNLIEYDLSTHPGYELRPVLAESWIWESPTRISFKLRDNVYFHDGTRMTAEDVKWNWDRNMWFGNSTGLLPANGTSWVGFPSSLYFLTNGSYIFDHFEADDDVDPLNFTMVLTAPFAALLDLIAFGATNILSPRSTSFWNYLDLASDILVGTGPYKYIHYIRDNEVRFERWDMYWGFPGYFEVAILRIIEDDTARMTAGLAGQFDYVGGVLKTFIDTFKGDADFHVEDVGEDLCYFYLEIYSGPGNQSGADPQQQRNNATLRRALAWAVNYTYIWEEIQAGYAVEGVPAVPRAMAGHNASVVQASDSKYNWTYGISQARELMASMYPTETFGLSFDLGTNDSIWEGLGLRTLEINRHFESVTNLRINQLLENNFGLIGINLVETIRPWGVYLDTGENTPWEMDIGYIGWCPDYLNPFNMIDPLFNLASGSCFSRINDTSLGGLTELMDKAGNELNRTKQLDIYKDIQSLIYDVERPLNPASHTHISGWVYLVQATHKTALKGVQYNVMTQAEMWKWYYDT
ncbi:MAG TPA: ABC transporter substrate-binding protein [bacterium]|nr:ABC transporter substrate-binding protein [bacterium]